MITAVYRVSIKIPNEVWNTFGHTLQYGKQVIEATEGNIEAGSTTYSKTREWATFHTERKARQAENKLLEMVRYFEGILP